MVVEELEKGVGLFFFADYYVACDCWGLAWSSGKMMRGCPLALEVDLHCGLTNKAFLPVTGWVGIIGCSVMSGSRRTTPPLPGSLDLLNTGMSGLQSMKSALKLWGRTFINLNLVDKNGFYSGCWLIQNVEESGSRWLNLIMLRPNWGESRPKGLGR